VKRTLPLVLLLGLSACNRHGVADVTLDAAAAQRNATEAKTRADLQAAADASRGPAPAVHDARPSTAPAPDAPAAAPQENQSEAASDETDDSDTNG